MWVTNVFDFIKYKNWKEFWVPKVRCWFEFFFIFFLSFIWAAAMHGIWWQNGNAVTTFSPKYRKNVIQLKGKLLTRIWPKVIFKYAHNSNKFLHLFSKRLLSFLIKLQNLVLPITLGFSEFRNAALRNFTFIKLQWITLASPGVFYCMNSKTDLYIWAVL